MLYVYCILFPVGGTFAGGIRLVRESGVRHWVASSACGGFVFCILFKGRPCPEVLLANERPSLLLNMSFLHVALSQFELSEGQRV